MAKDCVFSSLSPFFSKGGGGTCRRGHLGHRAKAMYLNVRHRSGNTSCSVCLPSDSDELWMSYLALLFSRVFAISPSNAQSTRYKHRVHLCLWSEVQQVSANIFKCNITDNITVTFCESMIMLWIQFDSTKFLYKTQATLQHEMKKKDHVFLLSNAL